MLNFLPVAYPYNVFLVILGMMILFFLFPESNDSDVDYLPVNGIKVGISEKIGGRGLFATKTFYEGEIVEVCPIIEDKMKNFQGIMKDYIFENPDDENKAVYPIGYTTIVNHSEDSNLGWERIDDKFIVRTTRVVHAGEEFFHNYGEKYWETRESIDKK